MAGGDRGVFAVAAIIIIFAMLMFVPQFMGPVAPPGLLMLAAIPVILLVVFIVLSRN
ncbi:hypothetical protein Nepgr_021277 [Nepenthes gracilis]|uniref:Transmembrane protein n=1 Tax=Nepenthes gracilis TaxID=150966 RepID=A0AAD3SYS6_NEPGR|nr:hypothetical protein Nepgr_021277 [Nepenthes gracilis]